MNIRDVLFSVGYTAVDKITGTQPVSNLPCPVVPHKKQGNNWGSGMCYPPGASGPEDPGGFTCRNCNQTWTAKQLARELNVTDEVLSGRERYVPPRTTKRPKKEVKVEPIEINDIWVKALAKGAQSQHLFAYFRRRWGNDDLADEVVQFSGWPAGFKQDYWDAYPEHRLLVPLRDRDGAVVSGVRRFTGYGDTKIKSLRIKNEMVGLDTGTPVWFGDPPPAAMKYAAGKTLYIAEGEIDTLLLMSLRELNLIEGGILGSCGGSAASPRWWDETAKLVDSPPNSVVIVMDADTAGDKYWQKSANAFPNARRVILPDGYDLTDVLKKHGKEEILSLLAAARNSHFKFYRLDSGHFAYLRGGIWFTATGRDALIARLRESGYDYEEAKAMTSALPAARDVVFDPSSTEPVTLRNSNLWLNQFRGLKLKPEPGNCELYKWLLHWLCNEDAEAYEYCMDWIANPLQYLYKGKGAHRNKTAVVFYGEQGTGKGLFWGPDGMMRAIYGRMQTEILQGQMEDKFDAKVFSSILMLVANEVACSGYRDSKGLNRLKAWITEPSIQIRRMRTAAEEIPVWFNMVLMSNDDMPIKLEPGDRRYSVFRQDKKLPEGVVANIIAERNKGWPKARHFLSDLLNRKIERDLAVPFKNTSRNILLEASKPSQLSFAEYLSEVGVTALIADWEEAVGEKRQAPFTKVNDDGTGFISKAHLHEAYQFFCRQHGIRHPVRIHSLMVAICKEIPKAKEIHGRLGNRRVRGITGLPMGEGKSEHATIVSIA